MNLNGEVQQQEISLSDFVVTEILRKDETSKKAYFTGYYENKKEDKVLIIIEPMIFEDAFITDIRNYQTGIKILGSNPPFYSIEGIIKTPIGVTGRVINPAPASEIDKYRPVESVMIAETPEMYSTKTVTYIESSMNNLQWAHNILDGTAEKERVIYRDEDPENGFVITPDLKWSGTSSKATYLLVLVNRKDIRSLRDLDETHIELLERIKEVSLRLMKERFETDPRTVRMYIHYLPSYFQFHVHVNRLDYFPPGINAGRAHLIDDVIANIREIDGQYYKKCTITYTIQKNHVLAHE